jgi:hypothetical protein
MKVELSKDQCRNLAEFIDIHLLDAIRSDPDIDNLRWVESMILAKNALFDSLSENALAYIRQLEAQTGKDINVPRWIRVDDSLPEIGDVVLVIASGKPRENIELHDAFLIASFWGDEGWIADGYEEWDAINVTHWIPLPESPKEGNA